MDKKVGTRLQSVVPNFDSDWFREAVEKQKVKYYEDNEVCESTE